MYVDPASNPKSVDNENVERFIHEPSANEFVYKLTFVESFTSNNVIVLKFKAVIDAPLVTVVIFVAVGCTKKFSPDRIIGNDHTVYMSFYRYTILI